MSMGGAEREGETQNPKQAPGSELSAQNRMQDLRTVRSWGSWVAQSIKHPTSAQVMISQFVSSSPTSGSVLTAESLEPALDSVSPFLSASPLLMLCLSLPLKNK